MNGGVEYKLWLDGKPVDEQFYTMIGTITVDQGIDLATEARVELEMCMDDHGRWSGPNAKYAQTWKRLRIEVRSHTPSWVPLIDGPIVAWDADVSGEPGTSMMTLVAHDDTTLLNVEARYEKFEGKTDEQLVRDLLLRARAAIDTLDIDPFPEQPKDRPLKHIKRGTEMEMLRSIADPYDMHVYVVPGDTIGRSVACVKRLSTDPSGLPVLLLAGTDRNVEGFGARNDVAQAMRYQGLQLDVDNVAQGKALRSKWTADDVGPVHGNQGQAPEPTPVDPPVDLLGKLTAIDSLDSLGIALLPPNVAAFRNVEVLVSRWQQRSSYTITAQGSVRYGCYNGVLRAYDVVGVSGVPERLCTNFVVREVTHTLARSEYRQDFALMTNATAQVAQQGGGFVPSGVF
ncbi:MAG: hypothetical protein WKG01_35955 [Kofleriaceae bacterium]